jgi:hypothetical protein
MNFLVIGKRPVFLALFLIVILAGIIRWNSNPSRENTNGAPSFKVHNQSGHTTEAAALRVTEAPIPAAESLALTPTLTTLAKPISDTLAAVANLPSLADFIRQVNNGKGDLVRGFYVSGVMALRVVPQPRGDPGFISAEDGTATLFQSASAFGVTGLLAHNFLSGQEFFRLKTGQALNVIYGDGHIRHYKVSQIDDFQRLSLDDLRSNFLELSSGLKKTADQVFADFYQGEPHLTLQTCIERYGEWTWGVHFIKAEPAD